MTAIHDARASRQVPLNSDPRFLSSVGRLVCALAVALGPDLAGAQSVTLVSGSSVALSVGIKDGVSANQTGRLCGNEEIGGEKIEICPARFRVTKVSEATSTAQVIDGDPSFVARGFRAVFDQPLVKPKQPESPSRSVAAPPRPPAIQAKPAQGLKVESAQSLLERANELFDARQWPEAAEAYRQFVARYPADSRVDAARKLASTAEDRLKAQQADDLVEIAKRLLVAGQWSDAKAEAERALALNPGNARARDLVTEAESHLGPPKKRTEGRSGVEFVLIPGGLFQMGCAAADRDCDPDEEPSHEIRVSGPYYLAEKETTVAQFRRFADATGYRTLAEREGWGTGYPTGEAARRIQGLSWRSPGFMQAPDHPAVVMAWEDAQAFCRWLGGRLPTEAEWEFSAKSGSAGEIFPWSGGDAIRPGTSARANLADESLGRLERGRPFLLGYSDGYARTAPADAFGANDAGLYNMGGNVWEWTADWYAPYPPAARSTPIDASGPSSGSGKVLRGGFWGSPLKDLRSSNRLGLDPTQRYDSFGFRCLLPIGR